MVRTSRLSFERRLKRRGIAVNVLSSASELSKLNQLKALEFWIWDRFEHARRYKVNPGRCCFQHAIGLPQRNGVPKPLFDYEKEIYNALQQTKYVWVKKATGLGITEFCLRYIA